MTNQEIPRSDHLVKPDYYVGPEEFDELRQALIEEVQAVYGDAEDVYAIWIDPNHKLANLVRTEEAVIFPEIPEVMEDYEDDSMFLAILDTREDKDKVVHAFRISGTELKDKVLEGKVVEVADETKTGIPLVDDILNSDQDISAKEVVDFYESIGVNLAKCVSVETNFRIEKAPLYNGLVISNTGYIALFQLVKKQGLDGNDGGVFAHLNEDAIGSLEMAGVQFEPMAGREDLKTPTVHKDGTKGFDDHYKPAFIPTSQENLDIFAALEPFAAPSLYI